MLSMVKTTSFIARAAKPYALSKLPAVRPALACLEQKRYASISTLLLPIDMECTCDSPVQIYPMEIIEMACIKIDLSANKNKHQYPFHEYVRPVTNPELTLFCTDLTGIMQSTVDKSDDINVVLVRFLQWMHEHGLISDDYQESVLDFSFVSSGNNDLRWLMPHLEKYYSAREKEVPGFFKQWINIKKPFVQITRRWPRGIFQMLEILGETPRGRLHSAIDDCTNLATVIELLHKRGCDFQQPFQGVKFRE